MYDSYIYYIHYILYILYIYINLIYLYIIYIYIKHIHIQHIYIERDLSLSHSLSIYIYMSLFYIYIYVLYIYIKHQAPLSMEFFNTGMGCHSLLQGIFPTQGPNVGLPHHMWILYHLNHQGIHTYINTYTHIYLSALEVENN